VRSLFEPNDGDIPLFLEVGNGNESDKKAFSKLIKKYQENLDLETIVKNIMSINKYK